MSRQYSTSRTVNLPKEAAFELLFERKYLLSVHLFNTFVLFVSMSISVLVHIEVWAKGKGLPGVVKVVIKDEGDESNLGK